MEQSKKIDLNQFSTAELKEMLAQKTEQEENLKQQKRDAYESIKADVADRIKTRVKELSQEVGMFRKFITGEAEAFFEIMKEYGQLKRKDQMGYTLRVDDFSFEAKVCKIKKFDERGDIAAKRLVDFLRGWIAGSLNGEDDPVYQLAMTFIERNERGELDYKQVSRLYALEGKFNSQEYSDIMELFRESNVIEGTATSYYFEERDKLGVWRKIEPSFNRV